MSAQDEDCFGHADRHPLSPTQLRDVPAAIVLTAFSSVAWIAKTYRCTEAQARTLKANAQGDFNSLMLAVRQAKRT